MSTEAKDHANATVVWLTTICIVVFVYVLSPPAVGVLIKHGVVRRDAKWLMIYAPLGMVAQKVPLVSRFYEWLFTKAGAAKF